MAQESFKLDSRTNEALIRTDQLHRHESFLTERHDSTHINMYSLERETFLDLCEQFPKAAALMQEYCIRQLENLSRIRQKKEHLHHGNYKNHFYRKNQIFMERKADVNSDLAIKV